MGIITLAFNFGLLFHLSRFLFESKFLGEKIASLTGYASSVIEPAAFLFQFLKLS